MRAGIFAAGLASLLLLSLWDGAIGQPKSVTLQTGQTVPNVYTNVPVYYNDTHDTCINTQYIDDWNNYNGNTYFWGTTGPDFTYTLGDTGTDAQFRVLIRFNSLHNFVPSNRAVLGAEMTVVFESWEHPVQVEACFVTRPWDYSGENDKNTGWRFSRLNGGSSTEWTVPGGWADCSPDVLISFVVPVNGYYGYVSQSIALDAAKVAGWIANNGAQNYGLLFRGVNGTIGLITSQYSKDTPSLRRPALTVTYATDPSVQPPVPSYPVQLGTVPRIWYVGTSGSDEANGGYAGAPFRSLHKALFEAFPGDKIYLFSGVYPGGVDVTRGGLTLQSAPGHWASISLPRNDPQNGVNVLTLRPGADYGIIQDLEISGGFWYGIMFFTSWEDYGSMDDRVANGAAPNHWVIRNVRIHDTGGSAVKLVMRATNNTFEKCEIYNTGSRLRTGGHGIEAVQAYGINIRDNYFHNIAAAAVHLAGGTTGAIIERNYVAGSDFGFNLGFATEYEYMDGVNNPELYESIDAIARNNIITAVAQAGINVWASRGALVAHNTIWQASEFVQAAIFIAPYLHDYTPSGDVLTRNVDLTLWANVIVRSPTAHYAPILRIAADGLDPGSAFVSAHNVYWDQKGNGVVLEDEREGSTFRGNAAAWAQHCTSDLGQSYCDINSAEADPRLDAAYTPLGCSPALGRAQVSLPSGVQVVVDDFHGRPRPAGQSRNAGAVQSGAFGPAKPFPPVPPGLVGKAVYDVTSEGPVYDKEWPYKYWLERKCVDVYVDSVKGDDRQDHNYESSYKKPFKTIAKALACMNQCDRLLLRGGQQHVGGFGIFTPNVTITTDPKDLPKLRATVVCTSSGDNPCIRTGDGLYGGAAAINLYKFDVVMGPQASGTCLFLNEGAGSGTSTYWAYYLAATGRPGPKRSVVENMALTNCADHGIKLSTFVKAVTLRGLTITSPRGAGIEIRGGADLVIAGNKITGPRDAAIRLGGGVRDVVVEQNLIKNFGERGILLGSDNTEVKYMDVDYAKTIGSWHDNIRTTVRNNILDTGAGAGIAFYSARDATVVHNTFLNVAATMQAGVLLNVSPKQLGPNAETGAPNTNIVFKNNIVTLGGGRDTTLMVEARILQGDTVNRELTVNLPAGTCSAGRKLSRLLRGVSAATATAEDQQDALPRTSSLSTSAAVAECSKGTRRLKAERRRLAASFAEAYVNAPGEQGRNPDGSCPIFPSTHAWHADVTQLPVHRQSEVLKAHVGRGNMHPDFGGGETINGQRVLYGIPFVTVDSSKGTPMVPIDIGPDGYADESDTSAAGFPFPATAPVEGAYLNCREPPCGGDRHVIVVDKATCLLYETYRSFPPATTPTGRWQADQISRFNLSRNALGRPLGWTSSDAAGMAVLPGLVKYDEVVVKGVIDHAIRFTGPNSREAYAPPATHFAANGDDGAESPYMGMRVRLRADFDCSPLPQVARVVCTALKKYGGIFADNGSPWFLTGEAHPGWDAVLDQVQGISDIPSSAMEVLDTGCLCVNSDCTAVECDGNPVVDPSTLPVYPAIEKTSDLVFANNIYFKAPAIASRYVDRRAAPKGFDGKLAGWQSYIGGDAGSVEKDPQLNLANYKPKNNKSPAFKSVPKLPGVDTDYYGLPRGSGPKTDAGAALK